MKIRRVVTGHDSNGKSHVVDDSLVEPITPRLMPGYEFHRLWGRDERPTFPDDGGPRPAETYFPPAEGSRFGVFTVPPGEVTVPPDLDVAAGIADLQREMPGLMDHMEPDEPGMHTTDTIDYDLVISGEITLELDDGEQVVLGPGDAVVQNGTRHRWRNHGTEPCVIAVVLIGADRQPAEG
jgi:mannose-6-phosphate isomerase-like protein (cupin superfamily)